MGKEEKYEADEGENDKGEEGEEREDEEEEESEESHKGSNELIDQMDGRGNRPFILPKIWTVNDFYPTMSQKVFNTLRNHHQIPDNILIRLPNKFKRCYSGKMVNVSMYNAMFKRGLKFLLTKLHHQFANYLGLSVSQITPNVWRVFIGAEVI